MKKRTLPSGYHTGRAKMEIGSNMDLSLLRCPMTSTTTGFREARSAFDKGTLEVRHLLLHECSLIYECNICRNMFRNLANFISHKRTFCCKSSKETNGDDTDGMKSIKEQEQLNSCKKECMQPKNNTEAHHKVTGAHSESLKRQTRSVHANVAIPHDEKKPRVASLQSAKTQNNADQKQDTAQDNLLKDSDPPSQPLDPSSLCSTPTYVFQCPSCSLTFLKSSSVIRHLAAAHNVPIRRIRMMRDSILKNPTPQVSDNEHHVNSKPSRELKRLQSSENNSNDGESKDDNADTAKVPSKCVYCQKAFERRAALSTHLTNCRVKMELLDSQIHSTTNSKRIKLQFHGDSISKQPELDTTPSTAAASEISSQPEEDNVDDVKLTFENLENQTFGNGLRTVSLDKLDILASESTNTSIVAEGEQIADVKTDVELAEESTPPTNVSSTMTTLIKKQRKLRTMSAEKQPCRCKICGKKFNALSNLRRHISMFHYRARKFGCTLCDYCAFRRYDIVNHLGFVHKMNGDRESMSKEYVRVNDVPYTKEDMNEDIVLCSGDEKDGKTRINTEETEESNKETQPEKRRRRTKAALVPDDKKNDNAIILTTPDDNPLTEVKVTRQHLKRSQSQTSSMSNEDAFPAKAAQKRPTRNRTKPVNKDFVYDLTDLLKKDLPQSQLPQQTANTSSEQDSSTYQLRGSKRRHTLNTCAIIETPPVAPFSTLKAKNHASIKGAARRTCLLLINQGLAASSTLPEIPTERPQMRPRLISVQRSDSQAGPVFETSELEAARLKALPLCDDSFLEKIATESSGNFRVKPCLAQQQHSAIDSLLQKVDSSLNGTRFLSSTQLQNSEATPKEENIQTTFGMNMGFSNGNTPPPLVPPYYFTPDQAVPKVLDTPLKPQKRLAASLTETLNSLQNYFDATLEN